MTGYRKSASMVLTCFDLEELLEVAQHEASDLTCKACDQSVYKKSSSLLATILVLLNLILLTLPLLT